ncbi:uncharacterized protein ETH [Chironomus tepperi]|uniref:uncharacterized protein ETH n=1 Tax=Chironomus tepperi TaxID=113505 RepID=UPI00391F65C9
MKITTICVLILLFYFVSANDAPGFFLKTTKNIPRLGKRVFIKQGSKNIPRLGRRSESHDTDDSKNYNHVQPFDSKFILDFLQDEMMIGDGDLKFLSWDDLDKALELDSTLKQKLTSIARDKEIEELRKFAYDMNLIGDHDMYGITGDQNKNNKIYQNFIPFETQNNHKYDNNENDFYYYYTNEVKRNGKSLKTNRFPKLFTN